MTTDRDSLNDAAAYSTRQAAQYVGLPHATVRGWATTGLVTLPAQATLSFNNLAELHVLKAMRRTHRLSLQSIRKALGELQRLRTTAHPLLDESFGTDGVDLCLLEEGRVVNLNRSSQEEIREFAHVYLQRIERDEKGRASRLFPFLVTDAADAPRHIAISPAVAFGRPVVAGTGVATGVVAGRFAAGDRLDELAAEYSLDSAVLEDAIRWEMRKGRAA